MKRKAAKRANNSTHTGPNADQFNAELIFRQLEKRMRLLERKVERLQMGELEWAVETDTVDKNIKRGPKSQINPKELAFWRNSLVEAIEHHWPEIEVHCIPTLRTASLRRTLAEIQKRAGTQHQLCLRHLKKHFEELCTFVASNRFRGGPRQIANALTGVPTLSHWTSLRLCQANPCPTDIGQRALKAYIRRKHPRLYRDLDGKIDELHFITTWRQYRKKDKAINSLLHSALTYAWHVGTPKLTEA